MAEFTSDIVHVPGAENPVSDALFRPYSSVSASHTASSNPAFVSAINLDLSASGFDFSALPALQSACPSIQSMLSSPTLSVVSVPFL